MEAGIRIVLGVLMIAATINRSLCYESISKCHLLSFWKLDSKSQLIVTNNESINFTTKKNEHPASMKQRKNSPHLLYLILLLSIQRSKERLTKDWISISSFTLLLLISSPHLLIQSVYAHFFSFLRFDWAKQNGFDFYHSLSQRAIVTLYIAKYKKKNRRFLRETYYYKSNLLKWFLVPSAVFTLSDSCCFAFSYYRSMKNLINCSSFF